MYGNSVYWSEQSSVRTKTLLMIDWIKRGIFGRDLSKVSNLAGHTDKLAFANHSLPLPLVLKRRILTVLYIIRVEKTIRGRGHI
jgi:hypothetical protein